MPWPWTSTRLKIEEYVEHACRLGELESNLGAMLVGGEKDVSDGSSFIALEVDWPTDSDRNVSSGMEQSSDDSMNDDDHVPMGHSKHHLCIE